MDSRKNHLLKIPVFFFLILILHYGYSQSSYDLDYGWRCKNINEVGSDGEAISNTSFSTESWLAATVPGTVLTTLLNNKKIPDPFYGMNNELIPDIYDTGNEHYTYWFINDFKEDYPTQDEQVWLHFRGINYSCEVFLNGRKLNSSIHEGMFLRQSYNITKHLARNGENRIAVIVYPPDPPGNPNGGQGGDGIIGRHVSHQYVAGWDWIQPVRDRNTGIWDKVSVEKTRSINIRNPHVVTIVPGVRNPTETYQEEVVIRVSAELENPSDRNVEGILSYTIDGQTARVDVTVPANSNMDIKFHDLIFNNPKLWWPNGYGQQFLYDLKLEFHDTDKRLSDSEELKIGIREISDIWNPVTRSKEILVNGQNIFIKGGNWIISDAMLRFSEARYDAEVRFHRDMNLNLIRIWGGAITERPEFYNACDKYGILVWQDFWISGDCNGRWLDPRKKEDQWTRRKYPDDHLLFIRSAVDQVKMIRNHPSLAIWCGGNEIGPPEDIVTILNDTLDSELDGTRMFLESSTSGELYFNSKGGVGDGPYGIQDPVSFWSQRSFAFNPELGSVGTGDYTSLKRFLPDTSMIVPGHYNGSGAVNSGRWAKIEPAWRYHKYIGYGNYIDKYGGADNVEAFAEIAQLINYNQYRSMVEGFSSQMWEWYTGFIIWKTQNPWTALRGQMYDWYLDPNAGLYGLNNGSDPLHIMFNPVNQMIMVVNNTFEFYRDAMVVAYTYDHTGKKSRLYQELADIDPASLKNCTKIGRGVTARSKDRGAFLVLKLLRSPEEVLTENIYWLPDSTGNYSFLNDIQNAEVHTEVERLDNYRISLTLKNPEGNTMAFFIRISLVDKDSGQRILPVFYTDNYISVEPGHQKSVIMEYPESIDLKNSRIHLKGWNVESTDILLTDH